MYFRYTGGSTDSPFKLTSRSANQRKLPLVAETHIRHWPRVAVWSVFAGIFSMVLRMARKSDLPSPLSLAWGQSISSFLVPVSHIQVGSGNFPYGAVEQQKWLNQQDQKSPTHGTCTSMLLPRCPELSRNSKPLVLPCMPAGNLFSLAPLHNHGIIWLQILDQEGPFIRIQP